MTDFHLQRPPEPTGVAPETAVAARGRRAASAFAATIQPLSIDPADEE